MICSNCGKKINSKSKQCTHCGYNFTDTKNGLPEEIINNQKILKKQSNLSKYFNLSLVLSFVLSVMFTFASYLVKDGAQIAFIIISYLFLITFFVLLIIKNNKIKNLHNNNTKNKK